MTADRRARIFDRHLRTLSERPSCYEMEAHVRDYCEGILQGSGIATEQDDFGNLFATRPGGRPGHVLLCAHMDKRIDVNQLGRTNADGHVVIYPSVSHLADADQRRKYNGRPYIEHPGRVAARACIHELASESLVPVCQRGTVQ